MSIDIRGSEVPAGSSIDHSVDGLQISGYVTTVGVDKTNLKISGHKLLLSLFLLDF